MENGQKENMIKGAHAFTSCMGKEQKQSKWLHFLFGLLIIIVFENESMATYL